MLSSSEPDPEEPLNRSDHGHDREHAVVLRRQPAHVQRHEEEAAELAQEVRGAEHERVLGLASEDGLERLGQWSVGRHAQNSAQMRSASRLALNPWCSSASGT